jgi:hypothetical protein
MVYVDNCPDHYQNPVVDFQTGALPADTWYIVDAGMFIKVNRIK